MENASKALIMAGSVLMALLIIGLLVMIFGNINDLRNTEATTEEIKVLSEYNRRIETFNRDTIYGSEVISLANLIDDYNARQAGLKGYEEITLEVTIIDKNLEEKFETNMPYTDYTKLIEDFKALEKLTEDYKKMPEKNTRFNSRKIIWYENTRN